MDIVASLVTSIGISAIPLLLSSIGDVVATLETHAVVVSLVEHDELLSATQWQIDPRHCRCNADFTLPVSHRPLANLLSGSAATLYSSQEPLAHLLETTGVL